MIRIKKNDKVDRKRTFQIILDILKKHSVSGATVWTGMTGFGKRGTSNFQIEGISINMPLVIEVIEEKSKLESMMPELKRIIGDNGFVTLHEVDIL
jgi:PII-like signaling protein